MPRSSMVSWTEAVTLALQVFGLPRSEEGNAFIEAVHAVSHGMTALSVHDRQSSLLCHATCNFAFKSERRYNERKKRRRSYPVSALYQVGISHVAIPESFPIFVCCTEEDNVVSTIRAGQSLARRENWWLNAYAHCYDLLLVVSIRAAEVLSAPNTIVHAWLKKR